MGDIEFEETIKKVNNTFGKFEYKEVVHPKRPIEEPIVESVKREVFGPESENMMMAYRTAGIGSEEENYIILIDYILANSTAGLIDLNLNQEQKVQRAGSFTRFLNDYGLHIMYGYPKSGQSLDEVKQLLLDQIELIKQGKFEDWMIDAVTNAADKCVGADAALGQREIGYQKLDVRRTLQGGFGHHLASNRRN